MPEFKRNFTKGRMNKDLDERIVPNGEYREALNVEVATSESSNVGTIQTLKGNTLLLTDQLNDIKNLTANSKLFSSDAVCVGTVSNEAKDKFYYFVTDPHRNYDASWDTGSSSGSIAYNDTYVHAEQDSSGNVDVKHKVYSDYIIEYNERTKRAKYVFVEFTKVISKISNDSHTKGDHLHLSNLGEASNGIRPVGVQVGMDVYINGMKTHIIRIEEDTDSGWNGWRIYTKHTASDRGYEDLKDVKAGDHVKFKLPHEKRALAFNHFQSKKPGRIITGINIIDNLLFWTDGLTEPKKINIDRCKYGSQQASPTTYPFGTRQYPTLLIVNGEQPSEDNGRLAPIATYPSAIKYPFHSYQYATVIKKSPTTALKLTMSNTTRTDIPPNDGNVRTTAFVQLPLISGSTASNFFFEAGGSVLFDSGGITDFLTFPEIMDWEENDVVEFYPEDDEAGFEMKALVVAKIDTRNTNGNKFKFEIISISASLIKPFVNFRVKLQQEDPLFEFVFPRFAYRWKYEDGEYSCYSPFSEVAFLPDRFDYLPKEGYNLGMTNNLRYLLLSGFKPASIPLDVVEIDILYKESNSPNVYLVETIKSPSVKARSNSLDNIKYKGDLGWFGKIKEDVESPNTLTTVSSLVSAANFNGLTFTDSSGVVYYGLQETFDKINMMVGDQIIFTEGQTGLSGTITIAAFEQLNDINYIALNVDGVATTNTSSSWLYDGSDFDVNRVVAKSPAIYVADPDGSLEIKSDMIHATLPEVQLLRPFDNVPRKALAQEVSGNRLIYGNYIQNYDITSEDDPSNRIIRQKFEVALGRRKNVRDNVQFDIATSLIHPVTGNAIEADNSLNTIDLKNSFPERSIKSLREYQVGIVWQDEYGRQTPIQTDETGSIRVKKSRADDYNEFNLKLKETDIWPDFATHFKIFIKDSSNIYYNLAMDRYYDAEDGNIWISFPSSERNKVDEDTYLILKKRHDESEFVEEEGRYKIIAIENEAPLYVKTKYETFGVISQVFGTSGEPKIFSSHVDIDSDLTDDSGTFHEVNDEPDRVLRISNATNFSHWYDIISITSATGNKSRLTVKKPFGNDMSFTTEDGTNNTSIKTGLSIEVAARKVKNLPEFNGRFFVKIKKDSIIEENILSKSVEKTYIMVDHYNLGYQQNDTERKRNKFDNISGGPQNSHVPHRKLFVSEIDHKWEGYEGQEMTLGPTRSSQPWTASDGSYSTLDIQCHHGADDYCIAYRGGYEKFNITGSNSFGAPEHERDILKKMRNGGQLFRWQGDTTIYRIKSGGSEWMVENFAATKKSNWRINQPYKSKRDQNHSVMVKFEFEPALGSSLGIIDRNGNATGLDAVGNPVSGYDPFKDNYEGTISGSTEGQSTGQEWSNEYRLKYRTDDKRVSQRQIQFLEEFVAGDTYTSDNPAIFETEPKENIDLDLYYEASNALPIYEELNNYKNKLERKLEYENKNVLNYYNCFSFANGVESNRVRDDFNAVTIDKGPKVSTVLAEQYREEKRKSGLIYSGIYNSTSGINRLNQFIMAEKITKDINPTYGSIQKLYSRDTDLVTFCEDRVIKVQANKDALFNADGNTNVVATDRVLGQAMPYSGDFGISENPESFASDQYRIYFTDKSRGSVMRLSMDGITAISDQGMVDYFKDAFRAKDAVLIGSFDDNKDLYNLTIKSPEQESLNTSTDEEEDALTVLNDGTSPTVTNELGIWFRYGGIADNWAEYIETDGAQGALPAPGVKGSTTLHKRGWAGIQAGGSGTHPTGVEHGRPGKFGLNPDLTNPITLYFDRITSGYPHEPSVDSTSRWDQVIDALNIHGANNVYLYQNFMERIYPSIFTQNPAPWNKPHQEEAVYSIQSVEYHPSTEAYEVVVNWLIGFTSYQDVNYFGWSLIGPFAEQEGANVDAAEGVDDTGLINITVSYSENTKGWTTFQSWLQECGTSLNNKYFTFREGDLYQHHDNETRNNFYGVQYNSKVCVIFNDMPSNVKSFGYLSYEGTQSRVLLNNTDDEYYNNANIDGWYSSHITTDLETGFVPEFKDKEGKWFNYIKGNKANNLTNLDTKQFSTQGIGRLSTISSVVSSTDNTTTDDAVVRNKLTIKDTGDTD